jgi:hypothetical protein
MGNVSKLSTLVKCEIPNSIYAHRLSLEVLIGKEIWGFNFHLALKSNIRCLFCSVR